MRTILTLLAAALTASAARGQRLNPDDYIYPCLLYTSPSPRD